MALEFVTSVDSVKDTNDVSDIEFIKSIIKTYQDGAYKPTEYDYSELINYLNKVFCGINTTDAIQKISEIGMVKK